MGINDKRGTIENVPGLLHWYDRGTIGAEIRPIDNAGRQELDQREK